MANVNRRAFLAQAGAAGATLTVLGRALGAADRVNVALIGCGGRGRYVARGLAEQGGRIVRLCDLMQSRLESTAGFVGQVQKDKIALSKSIGETLASKDVDAVIVATPDHWHARASILACQAGKDVYVEKPHAHTIWESARMVEAARKYKRIVQVGTQNRSAPYTLKALEYIRSGKLGKIHLVKVHNLKPGGPYKFGDPGKQPEGFDWDAWLGKAPARPFHNRIVHGGWHKLWDFCGGDLADDGIHQLDLALMMMGDPEPPASVRAVGGRYAWRGDDAEVPDVQNVSYDFRTFLMTFELTGYPRYMRKTTITIRRRDEFPYWTQNATRIEFYGTDHLMILGRHGGGWVVMTAGGKVVEKTFGRPADDPHYRNFLDCVKSRERPNADIAIAHRSGLTMHMGNIAHRVGNTALVFDPKTETFDNDAANALVRQPRRKGYEIPEKV
ncbi:Gfo/Idh/MocA family oxidoreductase [bacterium]|nr:Gfo/Idh/MocA family oxidoreductase [bacterium]